MVVEGENALGDRVRPRSLNLVRGSAMRSVLGKDDDQRLLKMTALLRLAEQLDRSRDGSVSDVRLTLTDDTAQMEVVCQADVTVAIWSAQQHTDIFKAAFGKSLEIGQDTP